MVFVLWLESGCKIGKLWDHEYWLVVLTGVDGMTPSATCSSLGTRVGVEAPRPTKVQTDLPVVPDTAWETVQYWLPTAPWASIGEAGFCTNGTAAALEVEFSYL